MIFFNISYILTQISAAKHNFMNKKVIFESRPLKITRITHTVSPGDSASIEPVILLCLEYSERGR